jgi:hypothetical protein
MISKLNLKKNLKKIKDIYYIQIELPNLLNDINYKIYGSNGFINYGILNSYNSLNFNNILIIPIDEIQNICISIKLNSDKKNIEYFDFFDMNTLLNISNKNIKINVTRINKNFNFNTESKYSVLSLKKIEDDNDKEKEDDENDTEDEDDEEKEEDEEEDEDDDEDDNEDEDEQKNKEDKNEN